MCILRRDFASKMQLVENVTCSEMENHTINFPIMQIHFFLSPNSIGPLVGTYTIYADRK